MISRQSDKYTTKRLRRNFFQEDDDESIDTNVISTPVKETVGLNKNKEL